MAKYSLRTMQLGEWDEVAELIYLGTNVWYQTHGMSQIFRGGPESARIFCEVYEALDPGCCILAINDSTQRIAGSCFYHLRETHVSLGIMNVHPNHFGSGIASQLLAFVNDFADSQQKPVRLVSSALNLDSFSLYTRTGFVPRMAFQDMLLPVPEKGLDHSPAQIEHVRAATLEDLANIVALERELNHIAREKDYRHFIENADGIWHVSVLENPSGQLDGFLVSVGHPGSNMLGPGVARTDQQAVALIHAELNQHQGGSPVFLIPVERCELVRTMYQWAQLRNTLRSSPRRLRIANRRSDANFHARNGMSQRVELLSQLF